MSTKFSQALCFRRWWALYIYPAVFWLLPLFMLIDLIGFIASGHAKVMMLEHSLISCLLMWFGAIILGRLMIEFFMLRFLQFKVSASIAKKYCHVGTLEQLFDKADMRCAKQMSGGLKSKLCRFVRMDIMLAPHLFMFGFYLFFGYITTTLFFTISDSFAGYDTMTVVNALFMPDITHVYLNYVGGHDASFFASHGLGFILMLIGFWLFQVLHYRIYVEGIISVFAKLKFFELVRDEID